MKRFISVFMAVVLVTIMASVAVSATEFVPSIGEETTAPENPKLDIVITPFDKVNDADDSADTEGLKDAYEDLKDLGGLGINIKDGTTVRDVYDVQFDGEESVETTIDAGLTDDNFEVIYRDADGKWHKIDAKRNSDGSVTFTLDKPGQVAILVYEGKPDAPQTSDAFVAALLTMAIAGTALTAVVVRRRHSN